MGFFSVCHVMSYLRLCVCVCVICLHRRNHLTAASRRVKLTSYIKFSITIFHNYSLMCLPFFLIIIIYHNVTTKFFSQSIKHAVFRDNYYNYVSAFSSQYGILSSRK